MDRKVIPDALSRSKYLTVEPGGRWVHVVSSNEVGDITVHNLTPEDALSLASELLTAADEVASTTLN